MLFANAILSGNPIKVFNNGNMQRDFTYIDDIVEGIIRIIGSSANADEHTRQQPENASLHSIYNIGRGNPVGLSDFISTLENALGQSSKKIMMPMQKGDVPTTYADTSKLEKAT